MNNDDSSENARVKYKYTIVDIFMLIFAGLLITAGIVIIIFVYYRWLK
jgi:hypothetical protein